MELSEAKEILKKLQADDENFSIHLELTGENSTYFNGPSKKFMEEAQAIDTVLKALDNSISKDEVKEKFTKYKKDYYDTDGYEYVEEFVLQELLGEE